jgi:hypothetical protein
MPKTSAKKAAPKKAARKKAVRKPLAADFSALFASLRKVLVPYARRMVVKYDGPGIYYLETALVPKYGTEVFFGAVRTGKRHVSFHFMPVHVFPELLDDAPPALRKHLKGESRFDFTEADPALLKALAKLARSGFDGYRRGGLFKA